jgi:hypothetical protein
MNAMKCLLVPVVVAAGFVGCQRGPAPEAHAAASASPSSAYWRPFEPPADGRITAAQVEAYIAVRRRALEIARSGPAASDLPDRLAGLAMAESRAARDLGVDPDEYYWVGARVAEATPPPPELSGLMSAIEASARKGREGVRQQAAAAGVAVAPERPAVDDAARADNRRLLERYRAQLDALRAPAARTSPAPPAPRS